MSLHLGTLYHWSPRANREEILRDGLRVMEEVNGTSEDNAEEVRFPWICCATTPSSAWGLLPRTLRRNPVVLDLWQVQVEEGDRLDIRPGHAPMIREVRIEHGLSADRVWWVGERRTFSHDTSDMNTEHLLKELLATIHRDGGQYARDHGFKQATEDAIERFHDEIHSAT